MKVIELFEAQSKLMAMMLQLHAIYVEIQEVWDREQKLPSGLYAENEALLKKLRMAVAKVIRPILGMPSSAKSQWSAQTTTKKSALSNMVGDDDELKKKLEARAKKTFSVAVYLDTYWHLNENFEEVFGKLNPALETAFGPGTKVHSEYDEGNVGSSFDRYVFNITVKVP